MSAGVIATLHNEGADRCVKILRRGDGTFGFSEFRRDPEDAGGWTLVADHPQAVATEEGALSAARGAVGWLRDVMPPRTGALSSSSAQLERPRVAVSLHNDAVDRCVDIIAHDDGTFGFKEFRRDPEDRGGWTLVGYNPRAVFADQQQAIAAARASVAWLRDRDVSLSPLAGRGNS